MNDKLKPCPFCGGEAELFSDTSQANEFIVECLSCNCSTATLYYPYTAVEAWNTRHEPELKEQLEEVFKRR